MMSAFLLLLNQSANDSQSRISLILAVPARYSRPELLNTSETIEFILDFSTGEMAGG
jgi:hypothetical protein